MVIPSHLKDILIFDREHIKQNRERARQDFSKHHFLYRWSAAQLSDRLMDINRTFPLALQIGSRGIIENHPKIEHILTTDITRRPIEPCAHFVQASEEFLPVAPSCLDLVISNLNLHTVNDLPGSLLQIRQSLKPDGLFLACMFGGETLHELRSVLTQTELAMRGGISPRIAPFADKPQMGNLLQRAGFALPVVDSEIITVTYDNIFTLLADLRGMGEGNAIAARDKIYAGRTFFMEAAKNYADNHSEPDGRIRVSFEIIFLIGWSPHTSQQKPLRPGSAENPLAQALGTSEVKI